MMSKSVPKTAELARLFGASSARRQGEPDVADSSRFFPHRVYVAEMIEAGPHGLTQATSVAVLTS